jgi:hypothetical protein
MTEDRAKIILEDAHEIIHDARTAKAIFIKLAIACIATILLAITVLSINFSTQKEQGDDIRFLQKDYVPLWVVNDLQENQQFMTLDIIAQLGGDKVKAQEISNKYIEFQKSVLTRIAQVRGGRTTTTRSIKATITGGSQ